MNLQHKIMNCFLGSSTSHFIKWVIDLTGYASVRFYNVNRMKFNCGGWGVPVGGAGVGGGGALSFCPCTFSWGRSRKRSAPGRRGGQLTWQACLGGLTSSSTVHEWVRGWQKGRLSSRL